MVRVSVCWWTDTYRSVYEVTHKISMVYIKGYNKQSKSEKIVWNNPSVVVARILLFIYFFTHMYLHFDQVKTIFPLWFYSLPTVPPMMTVMNYYYLLRWFDAQENTTLVVVDDDAVESYA
ncbi:TLC [Musa troglodytarum]|uniref:TLC n=1 Tax=Musa troglodytarum TaxID=320322 RepID=A0A9E7JFS9_9LILI|nr:TLC [Musa troglodytarum]